jgi:LacI family gluconate utilization system Gnt-I transcriptional repressor
MKRALPKRRAVKMGDVAKVAGVSLMTVSRAFRQDASVGEKTRARILQIADELGYVLDTTASNLRTQRSGFVAVIVPSINNANFAETVNALSTVLNPPGLQVLLGYDLYHTAEEERLIEQLLRRRPEAVVVTGGRHTERCRRLLKGAGIPVVEMWDLPRRPIGHVVGFSNAACLGDLVDHLVGRGAQRIAFIGGDISDDTRGADRRRGFQAAMRRHGLDPDRLVPIGAPPATMENGATAMARLLDEAPDTEAVVGVSDLAAFGALAECQRRGLKVPKDIAIAGFGAYDIASVSVPPLTTIDPHCAEIGRRVGTLIIDLLSRTTKREQSVRIKVKPTLKIGGSTD